MGTVDGLRKLRWAESHMPVIAEIRKRFVKEQPFRGIRIGMALHVEAKTGVLAVLLKQGGATVSLSSCNPLSSDDEVIAALRETYAIDVHGRRGESREEYYNNLNSVLDTRPQLIIDDGGDLTRMLHKERSEEAANVIGGNEETTTGVNRLRAMEKSGILRFPMFDVNDAVMKHFFDNRYGTGQSALEGLMVSTNLLFAGKSAVVAGYGFCGKGIASRLRGMGALVTVTEVDPRKAVEAAMDGFYVSRIRDALKNADFVVTATGMKDVITYSDLLTAKPGLVLANAGHFDNEIQVAELESRSISREDVRRNVRRYTLENGNFVDLISDGRLVNLASGQGHPVEIMYMSFAIQALVAEYIIKNREKLDRKLYPVPEEIDLHVAGIKLSSLGIEIDRLTEKQYAYMNSWEEGT